MKHEKLSDLWEGNIAQKLAKVRIDPLETLIALETLLDEVKANLQRYGQDLPNRLNSENSPNYFRFVNESVEALSRESKRAMTITRTIHNLSGNCFAFPFDPSEHKGSEREKYLYDDFTLEINPYDDFFEEVNSACQEIGRQRQIAKDNKRAQEM